MKFRRDKGPERKVIFAVGPDAAKWLRAVAEAINGHYVGTRGAVLALVQEGQQTLMMDHVNVLDILQLIEELSREVHERVEGPRADLLLFSAIANGKKNQEDDDET